MWHFLYLFYPLGNFISFRQREAEHQWDKLSMCVVRGRVPYEVVVGLVDGAQSHLAGVTWAMLYSLSLRLQNILVIINGLRWKTVPGAHLDGASKWNHAAPHSKSHVYLLLFTYFGYVLNSSATMLHGVPQQLRNLFIEVVPNIPGAICKTWWQS